MGDQEKIGIWDMIGKMKGIWDMNGPVSPPPSTHTLETKLPPSEGFDVQLKKEYT